MKFEFIPPEQLKTCWGYVRLQLLNILTKSPEDWIPEDVYYELVSGKALLFLAHGEGQRVGGAVVRPQRGALLAWAVWGDAGNRVDAMRELRTVAKNLNCKEILFETKRRGWDRVAPKLGFRPRSWIAEV